MLITRATFAIALTLTAFIACGDDESGTPTPSNDGGSSGGKVGSGGKSSTGGKVSKDGGGGETPEPDASSGGSTGGGDASAEAGPTSCNATTVEPASTVGCNGPPPGAQDNGDAFGACLTSCAAGTYCATAGGIEGLCLPACTPSDTYVSRGECPSGSRCFTFDPQTAYCMPDCTKGNQCSSGTCTADGACSFPTGDGGGISEPDSGTGGTSGTGGAAATGGATASGGAAATGGATATGGAIATGGTTATGGTDGAGGTANTGGRIIIGNITVKNLPVGNIIIAGGFEAR